MAELRNVIETEVRHGFNNDSLPVHRHTQLWTTDGELIVELCSCTDCETLEPPDGYL